MTVGDLRRVIEGLPDNMDVIVCYGEDALHIGGLGPATLGSPAKFKDSSLTVVKGPTVFEITVRDHA